MDPDCYIFENDVECKATHCPYMPREFGQQFDCKCQKDQWDGYMTDNILCDVDMFCTEEGALTTNLVENVWKCHLKFRSKHSNIAGDKYVMTGNVAAAHFNQQHIGKWDEEYCVQARFCEFLGVKVPPATRAAWT